MAYVTRAELEAKIPAPVLRDALDDDSDGREDAGLLDQVVASASREVDGYLAGLYTVPLADPAPAKARAAALVFACEQVYTRRSTELPKWLASQVEFWRKHLEKVANGEVPFEAAVERQFAPGAAITEEGSLDAQGT